MKKLLLSIVALLLVVLNANAGDVVYKTLTFSSEDADAVSAYTETWSITREGMKWTLVNFNNNKWENSWTWVKCGRKKNASTGMIQTPQISVKVTKFVVTVDNVLSDYVDASYLEVASDAAFTSDVQKTDVTLAKGENTFTVATPKENQYYRLSFVCNGNNKSSNGLVTISKIVVYCYDAQAVSAPTFTPGAGVYYEATDVTIANVDGNDVYYSFDDASYTKYTSPIKVSETKTLYAYAQKDDVKSDKVNGTFSIAKTYASLDDLLKEAPTAEGWPVIVPLENEEISSFYGTTSYRNGVYLTRQVEGMNFELYCRDVPESWSEGDKISGTAKGIYQTYNGQWEISLVSWDGLTNGKAEGPQAPAITFDSVTKTVTITDPSGNDNTIYYTLDGSEPDDSKEIYEAPFTISSTTTVKAVCYDENDQKSSVTIQECTVVEALDNLAAVVAACTATSQDTAPTVTVSLNNVIVAGINGSNVFVQDNTASFQFYGKNSGLEKGDVLSGIVTGKLYAYNGLPELSVTDSWASMTKTSSGMQVEPVVCVAADITQADANKYVRLMGLTWKSTEVVSKKNDYTLTDGTTDIVLRDQFSVLGDVSFNADCQYNINVFVIPYKETIEYYAVDKDDIEVLSDKKDAEITFAALPVAKLNDKSLDLNQYVSTKSDGAKTYVSSNETVATVDAQGIASLKRTGVTYLTVTVASTAKFMEGTSTALLKVVSGNDGTLNSPFTAGDIYAYYTEGDTVKDVWVKAYIVGSTKSNMNQASLILGNQSDSQATNVIIADNADDVMAANIIPVELPKGNVRSNLNLVDNPSNYKQQVWLKGNIIKYMSQAGLKTVSEYTFDATVINHVNAEARMTNEAIFNLAGQKVAVPHKGQVYIVGGKKVLY